MTPQEAAEVICGHCGNHELAHTAGKDCPPLWHDGITKSAPGNTFRKWSHVGGTSMPWKDLIDKAEAWVLKNRGRGKQPEAPCQCPAFDLLIGGHNQDCAYMKARMKAA